MTNHTVDRDPSRHRRRRRHPQQPGGDRAGNRLVGEQQELDVRDRVRPVVEGTADPAAVTASVGHDELAADDLEVVVGERAAEHDLVGAGGAGVPDPADDVDLTRIDRTRRHLCTDRPQAVDELHVGRVGSRRVRRAELHVEPQVTVDDVVPTATFDQVAAETTEDDLTAGEHSGERREECGEALHPGDAGGGELAADHRHGLVVAPAQRVVPVVAGQTLDRVVPVAVVDDARGQRCEIEVQIRLGGLGVTLVDGPVETECACVLLDSGPGDHDIVAALGVVVVVATVAHEHVVAGGVQVVEERGTVVALQQVGTAAALLPVVAVVAEHRVRVVAAEDDVVPGTTEGLGHVRAGDHEVVAAATLVQVETRPGAEVVVTVAALEDVVTEGVGDDVVAETTDRLVVADPALDAVVAVVAPDRVVAVARAHAVTVGGAVHRHVGATRVAHRAVGHPHEQRRLVVRGTRIVGDGTFGSEELQVEVVVRPAEHVGRKVRGVGVAHDHLGEGVPLELHEQVQTCRAGEVVEPVAVLQALHLQLEHVVEGRAENAAERRLRLGETTHPEIDVVETGDARVGGGVGPVTGREHEVLRVRRRRRVGRVGSDQQRSRLAAGSDAAGDDRTVVVGVERRDDRVGAVGRDEVDERRGRGEVEPEVVPTPVRHELRTRGRRVERLAGVVEAGETGVASTCDVEHGQVERQPDEAVAQRIGDELVDLVAHLGRHATEHRTGCLVGGVHRGPDAVEERRRVEEGVEQRDVVRRTVRLEAEHVLVEHRVTEAVHGVRELGGDVDLDVRLVAGEHVHHRLDLAGELLEGEVLVLHLGHEAGGLEEALTVPGATGELPFGEHHRVDGRDQVLDVGHEPVVLAVEHVVDGGETDVLVRTTVTGHEVRAEHLVVVRAGFCGEVHRGVLVGHLRATRRGVVRDVVEERVAGPHRVRREGDARPTVGRRVALDESGGGDDLWIAVRARDESAVRVGREQRDVEDVRVGQRDAEEILRLLLRRVPRRHAAVDGDQTTGRDRVAVGVEFVLTQEHLVRRVRAVRLVLIDVGRGGVPVLVDVVRRPQDAVGARLVRRPGEHHEVRR
ncbi:unannotated protein [freshwater metagenome]|uniref:Unannotated protein n=1 Tax=freshwater metagenome TaxID=449393 RepID=A0A6J6CY69_9ZZZZ